MGAEERFGSTRALSATIGVVGALVLASALVAALEVGVRVGNASSVYLLAVAAVAIRWGTVPALATAFGAFLAYNLFFVEPRNTLRVASAEELLTLLVLLFVGIVIGRLTGQQRDREQLATRRERESRALFGISRELATAHRLPDAMGPVANRLGAETGMTRIWIGLGPTVSQERVAADTSAGQPLPAIGTHAVLRRDRTETSADWMRIHPSSTTERRARGGRTLYRVELRATDELIGSLWCEREQAAGDPAIGETRLLAAAADQLSQAVRRDRLATRAADLEIVRRSDELRSALLDSVSHDLRTPLASIRAAASGLADPAISPDPEQTRAMARSIDEEAERLNLLVGSLLDMSRIQAGALVADLDVIPIDELIRPVVERMRAALAERRVTVDLPGELPSVRVDATFLSQALTNLLDNAVRHTPPGAAIRIRASADPVEPFVHLVVEDGGPGVADEVLPRLFERFYRAPVSTPGTRRGFGLGLTVVDGLVRAMGGGARAERSPLGGLAITLDLPTGTGAA